MPNLTMKKILTILLAGVSTLAIAQKRAYLSRSIDDDGKKLSIKVSGTFDGKEVDIDKSFDVEGMSQEDREALRDKVLSSIAEGNLELPAPKGVCKESVSVATAPKRKLNTPVPPAPHKPAAGEWSDEDRNDETPETMAFSSNEVNAEMISSGKGFIKEPVSKDPKGVTKHVRYNSETGEMYVKHKFMKNGDEYIYEKTVNAADKSEKERLKIIEKFESEMGLPGNGMEM
jgi:DNA-binding protein YbaB